MKRKKKMKGKNRERRRKFFAALKQIRPRPLDYVVIAMAVVIISGFSHFALQRSGPARSVEIQSEDGTFIYPLDTPREVHVHGPLGDSIVVIKDGGVRFTASPCRDKICIAAGILTETDDWTACLPNRVFITITGAPLDKSPVDARAF